MIRVDKIIPGGYGIGTDADGKKIFFWNALPGELVEDYKITKSKSHFTEAIATKISDPSSHRCEPKDSCYLSTSPWQIINYDYELILKKSLVVEIFREHGIIIPTPEIFTNNQDYFYRNKMEYTLYWDNDASKINLAFHTRGSHRKIPIDSSSIERPELFAAASTIVDDLNSRHEEARRYQSLLLRCNQAGKISGGLFENGKPHPHFNHLTDTILGHEYSYSPNGFFQINLPVYEMALTEIRHHIKTDRVLDLYSGVGTIGLSVACDKNLTLVECDKPAFDEMTKNITLNPVGRQPGQPTSLTNTHLTGTKQVQNGNILAVLAKSEEVTSYLAPDQTVILDPPRAGCDRHLIDRLLEVQPSKIIYLSCNPATQARDTQLLLAKYHLDTVKTYNFFPHTPHIENLITLSR